MCSPLSYVKALPRGGTSKHIQHTLSLSCSLSHNQKQYCMALQARRSSHTNCPNTPSTLHTTNPPMQSMTFKSTPNKPNDNCPLKLHFFVKKDDILHMILNSLFEVRKRITCRSVCAATQNTTPWCLGTKYSKHKSKRRREFQRGGGALWKREKLVQFPWTTTKCPLNLFLIVEQNCGSHVACCSPFSWSRSTGIHG